jgi:hypothetical protein
MVACRRAALMEWLEAKRGTGLAAMHEPMVHCHFKPDRARTGQRISREGPSPDGRLRRMPGSSLGPKVEAVICTATGQLSQSAEPSLVDNG